MRIRLRFFGLSLVLLALALAVIALGRPFLSAGLTEPLRMIATAPTDVAVSPQVEFLTSLTHADSKLDTPLTILSDLAQDLPGTFVGSSPQNLRMDADGKRVHVQLKVAPGTEAIVTAAVVDAGGEVTGGYRNTMQAWIPPSRIRSLSRRDDVYQIQTPPELISLEPQSRTTAPAVTTEGLAALNGDIWHAGDHTGVGVKIAIIDGGFGGFSSLLGTELPSSVTVMNFVDGETNADVGSSSSVHGTACAEVVHDVAPGAELYLIKISTDVDLAEAVSYVLSEGVDVVSTSIGWNGVTPNDGTGFFADLVASARDQGIVWVTAAGNFGETHWSGFFEDFGDGTHRFGSDQNVNTFSPAGDANCFNISAGYPINVVLQWDDWSDVGQDFDLYLYRWNGSRWDLVTGSTNEQSGGFGQKPVERIAIEAPGTGCFGVLIARYNATRVVHFDLFAYNMFGLNVRDPARSLTNLADSPAAITVGAVNYESPYELESFSSRGPTNGPGGGPAGGLPKPDIVAYDRVSTVSYGAANFQGTSAAAPHVAGAVALVKSATPEWKPDDVQQFLEGASVDQGTPGKDNEYGSGRLWLENLVSVELVDWPAIALASQPLTISWEIQVAGIADTYLGWGYASASGSPPTYTYRTTVFQDVPSGVYSSTLTDADPFAHQYYLRAFAEDANGSLWSQEQSINVDLHEPDDDTWQTAYALGAPVMTAESYVRDGNDVDWYTFEITRPGTVYTVTLTPPPDVDLDLALFAHVITPTLEDAKRLADFVAIADVRTSTEIAGIADVMAAADLRALANIITVGAHPGPEPERLSHRVWLDAGRQHVMVFGHNGEHSSTAPYRLDIDADASRANEPTLVSLPDYAPMVDAAVKTLFVANWDRINRTYGITGTTEIVTALNRILDSPAVMGTVIDLSSLDTVTNTAIVSQTYSAWDGDLTNPYLAGDVALVVRDVISDAIHNSFTNTQYIVIAGDDSIVPFMRVPDGTLIGNERAYRDVSGAATTSPAYGALNGGFYLTDDCYADADPINWSGGQLCVPDYPIGRLVESPAELVALLDTYFQNDGSLAPEKALITGYGFLMDQALAISETVGSVVTVTSLISDSWTAVDLEQQWISRTNQLQWISAGFDHAEAIPPNVLSGTLAAERIAYNLWSGPVLGYALGGHAGFSAHDADFAERFLDFAQAMAAEGAIWIGNTGYGIADGSSVSYSEDLTVRFAQILVDGMEGGGVEVGAALVQAKKGYVGEAAPGSFDDYDLKVLMETTLYGLPHWHVDGKLPATNSTESRPPMPTVSGVVTTSRTITIGLQYDFTPSNIGQVAQATVVSLEDSLGYLTTTDVITKQEITSTRPQLPSLSFDAVYTSTDVPRGAIVLSGQMMVYALDPIITRVITDHVVDPTEPAYEFEQWFPTQPVAVNRLGALNGAQETTGRLVLYPAAFRPGHTSAGELRAFEELQLRIFYADISAMGDWQAPVIRRVEMESHAGQAHITLEVIDPDSGIGQPSGVAKVMITYSTDGVSWRTDLPLARDGTDTWDATISLPPGGRARNLEFVVQAVDNAGNVAYSSNKGRYYTGSGGPIFMPILLSEFQ